MGEVQKVLCIVVAILFGLTIAALLLDDYEVEENSKLRSPLHDYIQPVKRLVHGDGHFLLSLGTLHKPLEPATHPMADANSSITNHGTSVATASNPQNSAKYTKFSKPENSTNKMDNVKFRNANATKKSSINNKFETSNQNQPLIYVNKIDDNVGAQPNFVRIGFDQKSDVKWLYFNIEGGENCNEALERFKDIGVAYWKVLSGSNKNERIQTLYAKSQLVGCFTPQDGAHKPAWNFFAAKMTGLDNKYSYYYQIGKLSRKNEEHIAKVETRILEQYGDDPQSQNSYMMVGDIGGIGRELVVDIAKKDSFVALIHPGDASYASNTGGCFGARYGNDPKCSFDCPTENPDCGGRDRLKARNLNTWKSYFEILKPITDRVPMMTTMGNHDNDFAWFLKYRPPLMNASFLNVPPMYVPSAMQEEMNSMLDISKQSASMKTVEARANELMKQPYFYSFDSGLVHFVSFGTEDNPINPYEMRGNAIPYQSNYEKRFQEHFGKNSSQYIWLVNDLKKVNRTLTPWVIAYTHRPFYHSANHHAPCTRDGDWYGCAVRDLYTPLIEKYGVNFVLAGHAHHYERSRPRINNTVSSQGPIYVVLGTGGFQRERHFSTNSTRDSAYRVSDYFGYVKMQICNSSTLHWKFTAAVPDGKDKSTATAKILDEVWIDNWSSFK